MLVDVPLSEARVLVVGGGEVAERKVRKLLGECDHVQVASKRFTKGLATLERRGRVRLLEMDAELSRESLNRAVAASSIVIVATNDPRLNGEIAGMVRKMGLLVNAVDNPSASDFCFPASARVGDVRLAVSTGGMSPAMAKLICRRLSRCVSRDDQLQIRLQSRVRKYARRELPDQRSRKRGLYAVLRDGEVRNLLRRGRAEDANTVAERIVARERGRPSHR